MNKCPTKAIRQDRFLISAEQCLTFFNEKPDDFPEWVNPVWHNCLIGCMILLRFIFILFMVMDFHYISMVPEYFIPSRKTPIQVLLL